MSEIIKDYRREGKYCELRKLLSICTNLARIAEQSDNPTHNALALVFYNQLERVRDNDSDAINAGTK